MTDFKYADFATWWDQQTDIDDDSEALARRIFKAARATDQAAPRTAPDFKLVGVWAADGKKFRTYAKENLSGVEMYIATLAPKGNGND